MERIVDFATDNRHISAYRGFMIVSEAGAEVGRIALDDIVAVLIHAHGVTWTTSLIAALAERGVILVLCNTHHHPVAVVQPIEGHHAQAANIRAQWEAGKPLCKQIWRRIVMAKIVCQGAVIASVGGQSGGYEMLARTVGSGDPANVEAQAARRYWPQLMGPEFRRDRDAGGVNGLLNYGYAILRSLCARAIVAAGLHPSIGIQHSNRGNAFALADDLVEPFRPLVDALTVKLIANGTRAVTPQAKICYARLIGLDMPGEGGVTTVSGAATRAAQSLAKALRNGRADDLVLPTPPSPIELAGLDALLR